MSLRGMGSNSLMTGGDIRSQEKANQQMRDEDRSEAQGWGPFIHPWTCSFSTVYRGPAGSSVMR